MQPGPGQDLRALALASLGSTEVWTTRLKQAEWHLERGRHAGVPHRSAVRMLGRRPGQIVVRQSGMVPRGRRVNVGPHAGDGVP